MKNPRVLMIDALVGNNYSIILCNALHKQGVDITLVLTEDRKLSGEETFKIMKWLPSKSKDKNRFIKTMKYFKYLYKIFFYIMRNADVVHFQYFRRKRIETIFYKLLSKSDIRLVYTVHDVVPLDENKIDRYYNNIVYKSSGALIVHSQPNKELLTQLNVSPGRIIVIPHGNFDAFISLNEISMECARDKLNLEREADVLLFFGFIKKYKGLDLLLEAFDQEASVNNKLHLLIAGAVESESLNNYYFNKISRLRSGSRVIFHNKYIDDKDVQIYFQAADIVVLPYKQISHSGVMHLAYTFGRPLIVTDAGDFVYTVTEDKSGFIVDNYNADSMASKIAEAFSDKTNLKRISSHIKGLNSSKYTWENAAKLTNQVYLELTHPSE